MSGSQEPHYTDAELQHITFQLSDSMYMLWGTQAERTEWLEDMIVGRDATPTTTPENDMAAEPLDKKTETGSVYQLGDLNLSGRDTPQDEIGAEPSNGSAESELVNRFRDLSTSTVVHNDTSSDEAEDDEVIHSIAWLTQFSVTGIRPISEAATVEAAQRAAEQQDVMPSSSQPSAETETDTPRYWRAKAHDLDSLVDSWHALTDSEWPNWTIELWAHILMPADVETNESLWYPNIVTFLEELKAMACCSIRTQGDTFLYPRDAQYIMDRQRCQRRTLGELCPNVAWTTVDIGRLSEEVLDAYQDENEENVAPTVENDDYGGEDYE